MEVIVRVSPIFGRSLASLTVMSLQEKAIVHEWFGGCKWGYLLTPGQVNLRVCPQTTRKRLDD